MIQASLSRRLPRIRRVPHFSPCANPRAKTSPCPASRHLLTFFHRVPRKTHGEGLCRVLKIWHMRRFSVGHPRRRRRRVPQRLGRVLGAHGEVSKSGSVLCQIRGRTTVTLRWYRRSICSLTVPQSQLLMSARCLRLTRCLTTRRTQD